MLVYKGGTICRIYKGTQIISACGPQLPTGIDLLYIRTGGFGIPDVPTDINLGWLALIGAIPTDIDLEQIFPATTTNPILTVDNITTTSFRLSWTPASLEGRTEQSYHVYINDVFTAGGLVYEMTFNNMDFCTGYTAKVVCIFDDDSQSGFSNIEVFSTVCTIPDIPTDINLIPAKLLIRPGAVTLTTFAEGGDTWIGQWTDPSIGDFPIDGWKLYQDGIEVGSGTDPAARQGQWNNLTYNTSYTLNVAAYDTEGNIAELSNDLFIMTQSAPVLAPDIPTDINLIFVAAPNIPTGIDLEWILIPTIPTNIFLQDWVDLPEIPGNILLEWIIDVVPPSGLVATGQTTTSIDIDWNPSEPPGFKHQIQFRGGRSSIRWSTRYLDNSTTVFSITGLTPDTEYEIQVRAEIYPDVFTAYSNNIFHSTGADVAAGLPTAPLLIDSIVAFENKFDAVWSGATADPSLSIAGYNLYVNGLWTKFVPTNIDSFSKQDRDGTIYDYLVHGSAYWLEIETVDSAGQVSPTKLSSGPQHTLLYILDLQPGSTYRIATRYKTSPAFDIQVTPAFHAEKGGNWEDDGTNYYHGLTNPDRSYGYWYYWFDSDNNNIPFDVIIIDDPNL